MDVAGMQVVLGAEYDDLAKGFAQATQIMDKFKQDTLNLAKVRIAPDLNKINDFSKAVGNLQNKNVQIFTEVTGIDQVLKASEAVKGLKSKTINVSANVKGAEKVTQLELAVKALEQATTGGISLAFASTGTAELLATLKQVQALSSGKIQVSASGKGLTGLNNALKNAATGANLAESALKSLQTTANTTMQFLAAQNASLSTFLTSVSGISAQATQNTAQLTQALQNTASATQQATTGAQGLASAANEASSAASSTEQAAEQASKAAQAIGEGFTAASAKVNTFVSGNAELSNSITQNVQILNLYRARMNEVSAEINNLAKMQGLTESEAAANSQAIARLGGEYSTLKQQVSQATSTINAQSKAMISAEGSYNDLQQQLTLTNQAIRRLSQTDLSSSLGKGMIKSSADIQKALSDIDAQMGIHVRNVGNYAGATNYLNQTVAQVAGEIPNFFQSMKIGFMSISNNIQPIMVALENLRIENAKLAASGEPTKSAFGVMTKAIFGWQTLLFVGVGLLSKYGGDLAEMANNAISNKTAVDKLADAQKEYSSKLADSKTLLKEFTDSLKSAHDAMVSNVESAGNTVGQIKLLTATMTNGNQTMYERKRAYDQLVAIAPEIAGAINKELTLTAQLADAINTKLIPALIQKAKAEGFAEQYKKLASDQSAAIIKQTELTDSYNKALENAKGFAALENHFKNSGKAAASFFNQIGLVVSTVKSLGADRDFEKQRKALDLVNAEVDEYGKHMNTALKLFLDANQYASTLYKTLNVGEGDQKKALQDHIKALQAQMDLVKKGTPKYAELEAEVHKAQTELKAYNVTTKNAKQHVDALTKSENNLHAALKQVDAQLQSGQITTLEAAKQKLNAYQKDLQVLFQHGGGKVKIDADLSGITELQKQVKELTASDVLKKLSDALNIDAQLNTAGATTQLEKVKSDLNAAKQAFKDLVSGKNALNLDDSRVIKVKNEAADLEKQLQALTKKQKIYLAIKTGDTKGLDISQDLKNGWLTPLEAAKERVKALETELKALQKAGADASVIVPVKLKWASAKQDSAVAEVKEILNQSVNKLEGTSITIKQAVDLHLISNDEAIQQQIRNLNSHLRDLYKGLGKVDVDSDAGKFIQQQIIDTLKQIDVKKATEDINKKLNSQIADGLSGIGESIGEALTNGGGFEGVFDGMMQSLGSQLETLGKWMIETATKFAILKEAFVKAIQANPVLGIAIGVATVALGATIKNAFQNKQKQMAFADGGIVYGRTNAIIGEYQGAKNNPEVVAPLNKLKNILQVEQGGTQRVEVFGVIDNDVIRLASERSSIKSKR